MDTTDRNMVQNGWQCFPGTAACVNKQQFASALGMLDTETMRVWGKLSTTKKPVKDRSEIPRGPDVNCDFLRFMSQVIRRYWMNLWCSPSAGCSQSDGRRYKVIAVHLLRWSCVFKESTPSVGSLISDSRFTFGCVVHFQWVAVGFISHCHLLDTKEPVLLWPFYDLCSAL